MRILAALSITAMALLSACAVNRSEIAIAAADGARNRRRSLVAVVWSPSTRGASRSHRPRRRSRRSRSRTRSATSRSRRAPGAQAERLRRRLGRRPAGAAAANRVFAHRQRGEGRPERLRLSRPRCERSGLRARAPKVNVRIVEFWTWVTPGFAQIKLDNVTELVLEGNLPPLSTPAAISLRETKGYGTSSESDWGPFIEQRRAKVREQVRTLMAPRTAALAKD